MFIQKSLIAIKKDIMFLSRISTNIFITITRRQLYNLQLAVNFDDIKILYLAEAIYTAL